MVPLRSRSAAPSRHCGVSALLRQRRGSRCSRRCSFLPCFAPVRASSVFVAVGRSPWPSWPRAAMAPWARALSTAVLLSALAVGSMQESGGADDGREKCFITFVDGCALRPEYHGLRDDSGDAVSVSAGQCARRLHHTAADSVPAPAPALRACAPRLPAVCDAQSWNRRSGLSRTRQTVLGVVRQPAAPADNSNLRANRRQRGLPAGRRCRKGPAGAQRRRPAQPHGRALDSLRAPPGRRTWGDRTGWEHGGRRRGGCGSEARELRAQ